MPFLSTFITLLLSWAAVSLAWHLYLAYQCGCVPENQHTLWGTVIGYFGMGALALLLVLWGGDK